MIQLRIVLGQGLVLCHADVGSGDIALAPLAGHLPAQHLAVFVQPVETGDGEGHALFHGAARDGPGLIQQAHAPQGVHRLHLYRPAEIIGQMGRVQQDVPLAIDHADAAVLTGRLHVCGHVGHLTAPHQYAQLRAAVGVVHRRGRRLRRHVADGRLRRLRRLQLPVDIHAQNGHRRQRQQDKEDPRGAAGAAGFLFC